MIEEVTWGRGRKDRAHVAANIIVAVCLLAIVGMGVVYVMWGTP